MTTPKVSRQKPRERVYVQIRKIRENKTLTKQEKAKAILQIKQEDVVWSDNPNELSMASRQAMEVLSGNDKNLLDDLIDAWNYCRQEGP